MSMVVIKTINYEDGSNFEDNEPCNNVDDDTADLGPQ